MGAIYPVPLEALHLLLRENLAASSLENTFPFGHLTTSLYSLTVYP